jgi:transcriptional regulator with XRE-family HTH domain
MQTISLGEKIKSLRTQLGISLRELARRSDISAPHLSDIELGRRFPSEDALGRLAQELNVQPEELRNLDNRDSLNDLKRMMTSNPTWGVAFKKMAEESKSGSLTPEEMLRRLTERKD